MKKFLFLLFVMVIAAACSKSDPWIGEWKPSGGNDDGIVEFLANGAVVYNQQSIDGSIVIYGAWKKVSDEKREISFKFDPSTIKVKADNPLVEVILYQLAGGLCSQEITFQFSEDYKTAGAIGGMRDGYVKVSSGSGKFNNVKPSFVAESDNAQKNSADKVECDTNDVAEVAVAEISAPDLIKSVYEQFVFGDSNDDPSWYFTSHGLKMLRDVYDYDCPEGDCYGYWKLRTGYQDGYPDGKSGVISIEPDGDNWYLVSYKDMGLSGQTRIKTVDGKIDDFKRVFAEEIKISE